jgi:hypothetical protein
MLVVLSWPHVKQHIHELFTRKTYLQILFEGMNLMFAIKRVCQAISPRLPWGPLSLKAILVSLDQEFLMTLQSHFRKDPHCL